MKIKVLKRCESGDMISLKAKTKKEAEKLCASLQKDDHVMGARLVAFAGGQAIINHVAKFSPGIYDVPVEVADCLIGFKLAKKAV